MGSANFYWKTGGYFQSVCYRIPDRCLHWNSIQDHSLGYYYPRKRSVGRIENLNIQKEKYY